MGITANAPSWLCVAREVAPDLAWRAASRQVTGAADRPGTPTSSHQLVGMLHPQPAGSTSAPLGQADGHEAGSATQRHTAWLRLAGRRQQRETSSPHPRVPRHRSLTVPDSLYRPPPPGDRPAADADVSADPFASSASGYGPADHL
jgi:hypothetical protein